VTVGSSATGVFADASGKFLLVGSRINNVNSGTTYSIDQSTGTIAVVPSSTFAVADGGGER